MVLDIVHLREVVPRNAERRGEWTVQITYFARVPHAIEHEARIGAVGDGEHSFAKEIRLRIAADRDVLHLASTDARDA